ncbi:MAG: ribosome maturation factor RimP [Actinobacteria bacterium]|nr:ribosome maturation factor RimP [Actinomycetota bacterium]
MNIDLYQKVKEAAENLAGGLSMEAVDVEVKRQGGRLFLSVYIEKDGGVTVEDCATANNLLSELIDREEMVKGPYVLEVMSPGLKRPLKKPSDFQRSIGKRALLKLKVSGKGANSIGGVITEADEESVTVDNGNEVARIEYGDLISARLDPELPW